MQGEPQKSSVKLLTFVWLPSMGDVKNIKAKLQIIKELSTERGVQQLAEVMIEYIDTTSKETMGFKKETDGIEITQ